MVTNNNNSNVILTTDRQGVSNRDMVGITAPQQLFFSMDLNPEKTVKEGSHFDKKIVLVKKNSRRIISRNIEIFRRSLDENNTGSQKGYKVPFHLKPFQSKTPSQPTANPEGEKFVKLEIKEILNKGAIRKVQPSKGEFLSN